MVRSGSLVMSSQGKFLDSQSMDLIRLPDNAAADPSGPAVWNYRDGIAV